MKNPEIQNLFLNCVRESKDVNPAFMNWTESAISEAQDRYEFIFFKSEANELASFICYQSNPDFVEILALGALVKFQRLGYSEKLLRQFILNCSAATKALTLEVHAENHKAVGLYAKCGFKTVRIRSKYYSDGKDALVMDCKLFVR